MFFKSAPNYKPSFKLCAAAKAQKQSNSGNVNLVSWLAHHVGTKSDALEGQKFFTRH